MKYFLQIIFVSMLSVNSCEQNKPNGNSTTRPEDYTSAKKTDTTFTPATADTIREKNSGDKKYFELLNAASEDWVSGISGGGRGTEYYFKIKITSGDKIEFDTAWIYENAFSIFISKERKAVSSQPIVFSNGDTITLRVSDIQKGDQQKNKTENSNSPIQYDGAALIRYSANNSKQYFVVNEIKKLKSVNRP